MNNNISRIGGRQQLPTMAPGILPGVGPTDLKKVTCKHCGDTAEHFSPISILRHASPLQTQNGQPMIVNFNNGFACLKCGAINEFNIEGIVDKPAGKPEEQN